GAMAKAGKGLLEGTLQAGTSAVSDKLLDLVGLGGKSAADKGKDTRDYLAAAFPELNAWERAGANAMRQAHADGWFIVFDTLTLADDRLEAFYDNPNALRDYFRDIGRMVLAAEGRKANDSHADCY